MFRLRESELSSGQALSARALQAALLVAVLASLASLLLVAREDTILAGLLDEPAPSPPLETLRQGTRLRFLLGLIVAAILACSLIALWRLRRRYVRSQEALRRVKMLAHDILASMERGVVTANLDGIVTSINSAGTRLLGTTVECVGQPLELLSREELPLLDIFREVTQARRAVRDRDFRVRQPGCTAQFRVDGDVLRGPEGEALGCVLHLRDVTDRMLMEERMRRMERFIDLASLASGLHHEIKNPLTALSIHVQLLEEVLNNGQGPHEAEEIAAILRTEVCRLNGVLENFRSFASLEHLHLEPTSAVEVIEKAVRLLRPQASEKGVQVLLLPPPPDLPAVPLDAEKFEQVLLNLMINALEAMPEGGRLTLEVSLARDELLVAVRDTGPGIPPEVQRHLFQPYFSTKDRGTGTGLALCEKLVGQHGGRIDYQTGPAGTTFRIAVPVKQRSATP